MEASQGAWLKPYPIQTTYNLTIDVLDLFLQD